MDSSRLLFRFLTPEEVSRGGDYIHDENLVFTEITERNVPRPFPHCKRALIYGLDKNWVCYYVFRRLLPSCKELFLFAHPCTGYGYKILKEFKKVDIYVPECMTPYYNDWKGQRLGKYFIIDSRKFIQNVKATRFTFDENFNRWKVAQGKVNVEIEHLPPLGKLLSTGGVKYVDARADFSSLRESCS
jgi:hypothetical protein